MKNKNNFPLIFFIHLTKEFLKSLIIFTTLILSLIVLTNFVEELFYLKDLNFKKNLYFFSLFYTFAKSPSILINFFPFVVMFSSMHFFVKILKNNEFVSLRISGISNLFIILVPSVCALIIGIILIFTTSPIASAMMKYYENERNIISGNSNLLIVNESGIWIKEERNNQIVIIRAENLYKKNKKIFLQKISIFIHDENGNLLKTTLANNAEINKNFWLLKKVETHHLNKIKSKILNDSYIFNTEIKLNQLNQVYSNTDTFSIWNINSYIKTLQSRGYFVDEMRIKFHRYISFPFLLFSTVILSTVFTINSKKTHENYIYIFISIVSGIAIYFLIDLSIALGKSDRIPIVVSVWAPILLILIFCLFGLLRSNEN